MQCIKTALYQVKIILTLTDWSPKQHPQMAIHIHYLHYDRCMCIWIYITIIGTHNTFLLKAKKTILYIYFICDFYLRICMILQTICMFIKRMFECMHTMLSADAYTIYVLYVLSVLSLSPFILFSYHCYVSLFSF